jgi:hypothetical protein
MTSADRPSQSRVAALQELPTSKLDQQILFVSTQEKPATVGEKEGPSVEEAMLLSPGQVSLNAVVKIEYELLPK